MKPRRVPSRSHLPAAPGAWQGRRPSRTRRRCQPYPTGSPGATAATRSSCPIWPRWRLPGRPRTPGSALRQVQMRRHGSPPCGSPSAPGSACSSRCPRPGGPGGCPAGLLQGSGRQGTSRGSSGHAVGQTSAPGVRQPGILAVDSRQQRADLGEVGKTGRDSACLTTGQTGGRDPERRRELVRCTYQLHTQPLSPLPGCRPRGYGQVRRRAGQALGRPSPWSPPQIRIFRLKSQSKRFSIRFLSYVLSNIYEIEEQMPGISK